MGKVFSYVSACRPATRALYPDAQPDRSPARQHHAFAPIFLPRRPAASCSASPPRCPGREGSRPSPPAEPPMIEFGHLTHVGLRRELNEDTYYGRSEEHTSELQSLMRISYAVFCLKKKKN